MCNRLFVFVCSMTAIGVLTAQPNCSMENVVGTYALYYQGTVMMTTGSPPSATVSAVPAAGVAIAAIDWQGTIGGSAVRSTGGQISKDSMPGKMQLNADCTGTIDWGGGSIATFVVLDQGAELNSMMLTGGVMGSPIIYGVWKRMSRSAPQCSPDAIHGTYAFRQWGTGIVTMPGSKQPVPIPVTMLGTGTSGYNGVAAATGTGAEGGQFVKFAGNGQFVVNQDCTMNLNTTISSGENVLGDFAAWGVVLDGGNEIWGITTKDPTGASIILGRWKRLSTIGQ